MAKQNKSQQHDKPARTHWRRYAFLVIFASAIILAFIIYRIMQPPSGSPGAATTINPTLLAKMAAWPQQRAVFSCVGGERIVYLGIVTAIADQRAGYTLWHATPAGTTMASLLNAGYSDAIRTEIRKIGDLSQYQAVILDVEVNYTISDWNTIDWIHQKQLRGYVEALCWSFHNQPLLDQTWHLDPNQQETLLDGLGFISAIRGNSADETLALYKTFNVELNPKTIQSAYWLQRPWSQQDGIACEMLDFINWLSRRSGSGIAFSPGEPARALIRPGGLPIQTMKCAWTTTS